MEENNQIIEEKPKKKSNKILPVVIAACLIVAIIGLLLASQNKKNTYKLSDLIEEIETERTISFPSNMYSTKDGMIYYIDKDNYVCEGGYVYGLEAPAEQYDYMLDNSKKSYDTNEFLTGEVNKAFTFRFESEDGIYDCYIFYFDNILYNMMLINQEIETGIDIVKSGVVR